jgi:NADH-quinone oxidoreductase subunit M
MEQYILTFTIFSPLVGIILILLLNGKNSELIKWTGLVTSILTFFLSLFIYYSFDINKSEMQLTFQSLWIGSFGTSYYVGIDGISLLLIMLTTFITPITIISSWRSIEKHLKGFIIMILLLEVGMTGVFSSLDTFLFYIFWELILIPMYFIIGVWGGRDRIYAALKFFLYTMVGSILMLIAIIWLSYYCSRFPLGSFTTNLMTLYAVAPSIPHDVQVWMFLAFALSFCIKVPLFPLHTWLPDAHTEAPTAGSVILAGVLLKMGTYGLIRFCLMLFPDASFSLTPLISTLAVIGIIYGALVSMVQTDVKRLVAYSSVSHLGFVVLGIFAMTEESLQGSVIQMINHGLSTGALFLIVGMLYDRRHTRNISDFGGLAKQIPIFSTFFMIVMLSSVGLPGLNGFVGEFLILIGSFKSPFLNNYYYAIFAASGVIFAAVYMLWMYQRVIFGRLENPANKELSDLNKREIGLLIPIILFIVWIGVYPSTFLNKSEKSVKNVIQKMEKYKGINNSSTIIQFEKIEK